VSDPREITGLFDKYGDITGPFRLWKIKDGEVTTIGQMEADAVSKLKASLAP
jgi:branched-chain amino acid transport system substrate-binding protein